jgi:hypothetical protein
MAQQRLAEELVECRLRFPEHKETVLGDARGVCFRLMDETVYLTFAPPRQERPAYRWVRGRFDAIFGDLPALLERRALMAEVMACVNAFQNPNATVTPIEGNPYGFDIKSDFRRLRFIHRPFTTPSYTYYETHDSNALGQGSTLEAALAHEFEAAEPPPPAQESSVAAHVVDGLLAEAHGEFDVDDALNLLGGEDEFDPSTFGDGRPSSSVGASNVLNGPNSKLPASNNGESGFDISLLDGLDFEQPFQKGDFDL